MRRPTGYQFRVFGFAVASTYLTRRTDGGQTSIAVLSKSVLAGKPNDGDLHVLYLR